MIMDTKTIPNPEIDIAREQVPGFVELVGPQTGSSHHPLYHFYSGVVTAAGASILVYSGYQVFSSDVGLGWVLLVLLTLITSAFSLKLPKSEIRVSVPDVFVFCSILLFGPAAGALTAAMEGLMGSLRARTKARRLRFALFNMSAIGLSAYTAGKIFDFMHPQTIDSLAEIGTVQRVVFSMVVLSVYYYILNTGLLTLMISLGKRKNAIKIWMESFSWMGPGYLAGGLMAGLLTLTIEVLSPISLALLSVVPLLTYISYRHIIHVMRENTKLKEISSS
jgi:hypothetical protein